MWNLTIRNKKEDRDYGEADIRFSPSSDTLLSVDELVKSRKVKREESITASQRLTFNCGSMWHEYLQEIIIDMGFIERENKELYFIKKIERPAVIAYSSGLGDLVGVCIPNKGKWLIDIKTMGSGQFKSLSPHFMNKYVAQLNLYGDWWGYNKLMILGVNKDSPHAMKEIIVPFNQYLVDEIYDRWVEAYKLIKLP